MKVVVTGASGRIGRAICVRLLRGHEVVGLDRSPSSTSPAVGDVGDRDLLARLLPGADAVVHTAALHAPHVGLVPEEEFERINVVATRTLIELARELEIPRLVFTSTTALYGAAATPGTSAGWVDELTPPEPRTVYHRTKLAAERLLEGEARAGGPAVRILRISRCFPEPAPLMAVYRLHRGVDARDVADAHVRALHDAGQGCRTYVISGATPFHSEDAEELWRKAPAVLRRRAPALVAAFAARGWPLPDSIDRVYDSRLAQRELGWHPRFGFEEVLAGLDRESSEVLPPRRLIDTPP